MISAIRPKIMSEYIPKLMTIGELAIRFGVSTHRLKYAIEQYRIEPTRRVGIIRVWSEDKVVLIQNALAKIAGKRNGTRIHDQQADGESGRLQHLDASDVAATPTH